MLSDCVSGPSMIELRERLLRKVREYRHTRQARAVLDTPPLIPSDDGVILYSMIGTRVLLPYLVSIKSLHAQLQCGRIVILNDGTLTDSDKALLAHHLGNPEIRHIGDVDIGPCPRGGTWERLLTLLDLRKSAYVIQVDSDTVTVGPLPEVVKAISAGRSFTLQGDGDSALLSLTEIAARTPARLHRDNPAAHVQSAIESVMDQIDIPGRADLRYIRGCSGFAGFARSADGRLLAEQFSQEAERLVGKKRWSEWGSEQVTSNFVVANEPDPLPLPADRYVNFWDEDLPRSTPFIHFIGTYRFHRGAYVSASRQVIAALKG